MIPLKLPAIQSYRGNKISIDHPSDSFGIALYASKLLKTFTIYIKISFMEVSLYLGRISSRLDVLNLAGIALH